MKENWENYSNANAYEVLEVSYSATQEEIKRAYREMARRYHSDHYAGKNIPEDLIALADEKMKEVNWAYSILRDPDQRRKYDEWLGINKPKPKPKVEPPVIRFDNVEPGRIQTASFVIKNVGGPYTKIKISNPDSFVRVARYFSLSDVDELPLKVEIEAEGKEWEKTYVESIRVQLDQEETHVEIRLRTKPKPTKKAATTPRAKSTSQSRVHPGAGRVSQPKTTPPTEPKIYISYILSMLGVLVLDLGVIKFVCWPPSSWYWWNVLDTIAVCCILGGVGLLYLAYRYSGIASAGFTAISSTAKFVGIVVVFLILLSIFTFILFPFGVEGEDRFWLWFERIHKVTHLSNLVNSSPSSIVLGHIKQKDLKLFSDKTSLRYLSLEDSDLNNLQPLANLTQLTDLDLVCNNIKDLWPLAGLINLKTLRLYSNKINNIEPLANLNKLVDLDLSYNKISDIEPLANLNKLVDLDLRNNDITGIKALLHLKSLKRVKISFNPLNEVSVKVYIPALEKRGVEVHYSASNI